MPLFQFLGNVNNPFTRLSPGKYTGTAGEGLITLLNNMVRLAIVAAGIYAFFNLILAGYAFLSAGGDPKNITKAWEKIWQTLLGLMIVAGSFVLAAIFGWVIFHDATALLSPKVYGP